MLKLKQESIEITLTSLTTYTLDSADNKPYDKIFNPLNLTRKDHYGVQELVFHNGIEKLSCILIGKNDYSNESAILHDNYLIVLSGEYLFLINLTDFEIDRIILLKSMWSVYYEIIPLENGYLIIGELVVLELNQGFEIKKEFNTADVIITWHILQNKLLLEDLEARNYEFDL